MDIERDHARPLASKLAVVLWQLPGNLRKSAESIRQWRREGRQVHVYFDNDAEGVAPGGALKLPSW